MKYRIEDAFWTQYNNLPPNIQSRILLCLEMLEEDPPRPSLQLKRLNSPRADWSARVNRNYRMVAKDEPNGDITWLWVGHHHAYDRFLKRR